MVNPSDIAGKTEEEEGEEEEEEEDEEETINLGCCAHTLRVTQETSEKLKMMNFWNSQCSNKTYTKTGVCVYRRW